MATAETDVSQLSFEAALADAGDEVLRDEIFPGIRDPFKNTPSE